MLRTSPGTFSTIRGQVGARPVERIDEAAAASPPCSGGPWPTSRCSGRNGRSDRGGARRRKGWTPAGPRPTANAGAVPIDSGTTSTLASGHHSARSRQARPKSIFSSENGVSGRTSGTLWCGTPRRSATAALSRLWRSKQLQHPLRLAQRGRLRDGVIDVDRVDEPHPSVVHQRVAAPEQDVPGQPTRARVVPLDYSMAR